LTIQVHAKVLCIAWTADGTYLAAGHFDGTVTIRDKNGADKLKIEASTSPVWTLAWNPQDQNVLATGCWDGMLKFFQISGAQKAKDRELGFDPCSLSYFGTGDYLTVGGTDRWLLRCTSSYFVPTSSRIPCSSAAVAASRLCAA
jgi:intraflagellar transport protein 122